MTMNKKKNQKEIMAMLNVCLRELKPLGIYVTNKSVTTSSVYLKFKDPRIKSLTIRDHGTIPKYRYKWNVILGYRGPGTVNDKGVTRYMYNELQLHSFFEHIRKYAAKIKKNSGEI